MYNRKEISISGNTGTSISIVRLIVLMAATVMMFFSAVPLEAGTMSSAQAVAMGGAFTSLATGVDAARFNPANLGLRDYQVKGLELVGFGANISNNSFTLDDYNRYTGAYLTDADKNDILQKIPKEGLNINAEAHASVFSLSLGSFVFSGEGIGAADVNLNKDIIGLVLNGNSFADTIRINGTHSEAIGYATFGISYGRPIYQFGTRQVAIGASLKYIRGFGIEEIIEVDGMATTDTTGFAGQGEIIARTATGGSGYAIDFGAALRFNQSYTIGASVRNILSSISWNSSAEEHGYLFNFDTLTIDNIEDDFFVSDDYTKPIDGFKTSLPAVLTVGLAKTSGSLLWAVDWEQGFRRAAGASSKPRIAAGVQWSLIRFLPLRMGYSLGGNRDAAFSFGSGLGLSAYYLDLAFVTGSRISGGSSKGLNFAVTTGIRF